MTVHLREAWRVIGSVRVTPGSPLSYNKQVTHRLSLHGRPSQTIEEWKSRWETRLAESEVRWLAENPGKRSVPVGIRRDWEGSWHRSLPTSYTYFNPVSADPNMNTIEPAPADLTAFVDVSLYGNMVEVLYLAVRPDHRGQGLARQLMQAVYDTWPQATVHWGKLMSEGMGHLYHWYREREPDRTVGGSRYYKKAGRMFTWVIAWQNDEGFGDYTPIKAESFADAIRQFRFMFGTKMTILYVFQDEDEG